MAGLLFQTILLTTKFYIMSLLNVHINNTNFDFSQVRSLTQILENSSNDVFDNSILLGIEFKKFDKYYSTKPAKAEREADEIYLTKKEYLSQMLGKSYSQIAKLIKAANNSEQIETFKTSYQAIKAEFNLSLGLNIEKFNNFCKFMENQEANLAIKKAYKLGEFSENAARQSAPAGNESSNGDESNGDESNGDESNGNIVFQFVAKCESRGNISTRITKSGEISGGDKQATIERLREMIFILEQS